MKGLMAFDVDGTLTHHFEEGIDPRVVDALTNLAKNDWEVALVTGRPFAFSQKALSDLAFPHILAVQNGADILSMPDEKSLTKNYLTPDLLPQIEEAHSTTPGDYIIYSGKEGGDFCYYRPDRFDPKTLKYLKILEDLGGQPWKSSDFKFVEGTQFALIKCFGPKEEMSQLFQKLSKISQIEVSLIRDPIDPRLYLNLITHPKANKGSVVDFLKTRDEFPIVIAAGDDQNDRKMLEKADVKIVIETAPKELLDMADIVAKPAKELGIIKAIEEAISYASR